jgi:hypothetical protein
MLRLPFAIDDFYKNAPKHRTEGFTELPWMRQVSPGYRRVTHNGTEHRARYQTLHEHSLKEMKTREQCSWPLAAELC